MTAAVVYRGRWLESLHDASVVVVGRGGELCGTLGDPDRAFAARSAIKPFQLLPLLLSGAAERFGFGERELAIMCASHDGTDEHRDAVMAALDRSGCGPADLRCGTHVPLHLLLSRSTPHLGEERDPVRHNCSGKHAGFLAQAVHLGEDRARYLDPDSETQTRVRRALAEICAVPLAGLTPCVDGCSAPNYALPLRALAVGFLRLATGAALSRPLEQAVAQVAAAMRAAPELVSGEGRLDLDLMRAFPGRVLCKVGGEAIEGIGFSDPPLGIAVKIHDGNFRALRPVCVEVLRQLGLVTDPLAVPSLRRHVRPTLLNDAGLEVGHIETCFELRTPR